MCDLTTFCIQLKKWEQNPADIGYEPYHFIGKTQFFFQQPLMLQMQFRFLFLFLFSHLNLKFLHCIYVTICMHFIEVCVLAFCMFLFLGSKNIFGEIREQKTPSTFHLVSKWMLHRSHVFRLVFQLLYVKAGVRTTS